MGAQDFISYQEQILLGFLQQLSAMERRLGQNCHFVQGKLLVRGWSFFPSNCIISSQRSCSNHIAEYLAPSLVLVAMHRASKMLSLLVTPICRVRPPKPREIELLTQSFHSREAAEPSLELLLPTLLSGSGGSSFWMPSLLLTIEPSPLKYPCSSFFQF